MKKVSKKQMLLTPIICAFVAISPLTALAQSAQSSSYSSISSVNSDESHENIEFEVNAGEKIVQAFSGNEILFEDVEKGKLKELESLFPDKINTLLNDGSTESEEITWECEKDYENTAYAEYQFNSTIKNEYPTIDQVLGCTKTVESWLNQHTNDVYYLGTLYEDKYYDEGAAKSPYGDVTPGYSAGMNGTGFVAHVLEQCGADLSPIRNTKYNSCTAVTNLSKWVSWIKTTDVQYYFFDSINDLLCSGRLQKGDIILFEPYDWSGVDQYGNLKDSHIGFFWGESPSEDKWWHSAHPVKGIGEDLFYGNQFSRIIPNCADCGIYLFPVRHTESQSSANGTERIHIQSEASPESAGGVIHNTSSFIKNQNQSKEQIPKNMETTENPFGGNGREILVNDQAFDNNYLAYGLKNVKKIRAWTQTVRQSEGHTEGATSVTCTDTGIAIVIFTVAAVSILNILSKWKLPKQITLQ